MTKQRGDSLRDSVRLRAPRPEDVPLLFEYQRDPASNAMAMTIPRDAATFEAVWGRISENQEIVARVIVVPERADDVLQRGEGVPERVGDIAAQMDAANNRLGGTPERVVGSISRFPRDGLHYIGYWIAREYWGRGIATRALELLLAEVASRPLYAQAARSNAASIRVLERCGFVLTGYRDGPADERHQACEEALFKLE